MDRKKYLETLNGALLQAYPMLVNAVTMKEDYNIDRPSFIFMDDNPGAHRAKIVEKWKQEKGIKNLSWPSNSPDLNILLKISGVT